MNDLREQTTEIQARRIQLGNILARAVIELKYFGKISPAELIYHLKHQSQISLFHRIQPTPCIMVFLSPSICLCRNFSRSVKWSDKMQSIERLNYEF